MPELHFITLAEAAKLIEARKLSPVELTQAYLRRIEALDEQINAFITLTGELAIEQARKAEAEIAAGRYRGPLHGVAFGLKDLYATAGILTTGHSRVRIDHVPKADATTTAKLYQAGAVLLGKLATCEFAHGAPAFDAPWPPARNPWNPVHFTGGSSSGSGAAVAAGFLPGALGSDTGGSVRIPAAMCGTVGLKPTYGLVSRYGVTPNSFTFDHCGPLTWTVEDCAIMLGAIAGYDARDSGSVDRPVPDYRAALRPDLRGVRVGVVRHFWEEDVKTNEQLARAMDDALDVLKRLGAKVEDARMRPLQDYVDVKMVISETEIFCVHHKDLIARADEFGLNFLAQTLTGCLFQSPEYVAAQRERRRMLAEMRPLYENYDVLVTTSSSPAPRFDQYSPLTMWLKPNIHVAFSVTAGPAIALCNGYTTDGLPLSMQIAGAPFADQEVLRVAHAYEQATPWRGRRPNLIPGVPRAPVTPPPCLLGVPVDAATRAQVELLARRAGLKLNDTLLALLCEVAPHAFAMGARIRRDHGWTEEPADVFRPTVSA
ncbi:MAG: amidase [Betaproteobacteria bacterium]|nr:amidase [Betaproteobacteria bacterium]